MTSDWLSDAEIEALEVRHQFPEWRGPENEYTWCVACGAEYPCPTARLIAEVRERRAHECTRIWYARGEDGFIYQVEPLNAPQSPQNRAGGPE